jgi:tetratricopeptide (TPR) repeat protein
LDARTDIFSLGVVFYELLASQRPFGGTNAVETIDAILHKDPDPLTVRGDPRISHVEGILGRMLEKDRERRYASLGDVCQDLAALRRRETPPSSGGSLQGVLAVLAFANVTGGGEDQWLGAGIADTLMADLRGANLSLVGRERILEAMRRLGGEEPRIDEALAVKVGRDVGARWVVSGGFQRMGDAIRITANVLEAETGAVVHALKLDGRMAEIFALQDRLVRELSVPFRATLAPEVKDTGETHVLAAYEAFSKGVLNLREETYESLDRAVLFLERAVSLDPGYRRAHLELGVAYLTRADYLGVPELYERALASFRRALEGRPEFLRAWREIGLCLLSLGREDEGIAAIEKALALSPDEPTALMAMGRALFIGKADFRQAAAYFERALERRPDAGWYALQLSHCAALLRDLPRGEAAARRAIELQEAALSGREGIRVVGSYMRLGHVLALQERFGPAVEAFQQELSFLQRVDHALRSRIAIELHMRLGSAQKQLGRHEAARASLDIALQAFERRVGMGADEPFTRYYAACAYALRGDKEIAIACLEKAAKVRPRYTLERARIDPEFDGLRDMPAFRELIGLA